MEKLSRRIASTARAPLSMKKLIVVSSRTSSGSSLRPAWQGSLGTARA